MKFCIIRKVPFRLPGKKARIVWGHVLCEHEGLAMVLVPKVEKDFPHSIFFAEENIAERVFQSIGPHRFDLETEDMLHAADKLKMLGRELTGREWKDLFEPDDN